MLCASLKSAVALRSLEKDFCHRVAAASQVQSVWPPAGDSSLACHPLGSHREGLTASQFPLVREDGGGRRPGRGVGCWHTEGQFCSLGDLEEAGWSPQSVELCPTQNLHAVWGCWESQPDKGLGGHWQGLPVRPGHRGLGHSVKRPGSFS